MSRYPKTIKIDKQYVSGFDKICIGLENCEAFDVCVDEVADIDMQANLWEDGYKRGLYKISSGFIKLTKNGAEAKEICFSKHLSPNEENQDMQLLCDRLSYCCDVVSFSLEKDGYKIEIFPPYDTLESICGGEIEMSNCPSGEFDEEGNFLILFGESSKAPRRKDNNYHEIVKGWQNIFKEYITDNLEVEIKDMSISNLSPEKDLFSYINVSCQTKINKKSYCFDLMFRDISCFSIESLTFLKEKGRLFMSKMQNGNIYVAFEGASIDFYCKEVWDYATYCNQDGDE